MKRFFHQSWMLVTVAVLGLAATGTETRDAVGQTEANSDAKPGTCLQELNKPGKYGDAFVDVKTNPSATKDDRFSYRRYFCSGFTKGALVQATVYGSFRIEKLGPDGSDAGIGAGFVQLGLQFEGPNNRMTYITECFKDTKEPCVGVQGLSEIFRVPESPKDTNLAGWTIQPTQQLQVEGFADEHGEIVLDVYALRAQNPIVYPTWQGVDDHLRSRQHPISALDGSWVKIQQVSLNQP